MAPRYFTCQRIRVVGTAALIVVLPWIIAPANALPHTGSAPVKADAPQKTRFKVGPYILLLPAGSQATQAEHDAAKLRRFVLPSLGNMKMIAMIARGPRGHPAARAPETVCEILAPTTFKELTATLWAYRDSRTDLEDFFGTVHPAAASSAKKMPYLIIVTSGRIQAESVVIGILKDVRTTKAVHGAPTRAGPRSLGRRRHPARRSRTRGPGRSPRA